MSQNYQVVRMFGADFGVIYTGDAIKPDRLVCVSQNESDARKIADALNAQEQRDDF